MGKSGKERKKRRLEAEVLSSHSNRGSENDGESHDYDQSDDLSSPLSAVSVSNAISCLKHTVSRLQLQRDSGVVRNEASTSINGTELKVLRKVLYPLIQRQIDKYFDVTDKLDMASDQICNVNYDFNRAISTFRAFQENIEFFDSPSVKELRRAMHPLVLLQRAAEGQKKCEISLSGEVALAFNSKDWHKALVKLLEMKRAGDRPKLGALQRWVRQSDGAASKSLSILLLSLIIRLSDKNAWGLSEEKLWRKLVEDTVHGSAGALEGRILHLPAFRAPQPCRLDNSVYLRDKIPCFNKEKFPILEVVKGPDRRPPNELDLVIYVSTPGALQFDHRYPSPQECVCRGGRCSAIDKAETDGGEQSSLTYCSQCLPIYRSHVPGVNGALLLSNVLTPRECQQFMNIAESFGYVRDAVDGIEAFVMMGDDALLGPIFDRCKHLLPQQTADGKPLKCINPRLRFFRYSQGAEYHPHIDGSWTLGGSDKSYYSEGKDATEHSYMTFLIYLNGGFDGGGTTFFVAPSDELSATANATTDAASNHADEDGSFTPIIAQSVEPVEGSILCFPHGIVEGSLVHEGSAVKSGVKYVIRSDIMFTVT
jgi:hypothetical protein